MDGAAALAGRGRRCARFCPRAGELGSSSSTTDAGEDGGESCKAAWWAVVPILAADLMRLGVILALAGPANSFRAA